jgi:hypothetical protein
MGLQSVIKEIVSRMEKVDTMNMNALEQWRKRVFGIAKDIGQSNDTSRFVNIFTMAAVISELEPHNRQESFETAIRNVAQRFIGASLDQPDTVLYRLEPEAQENRKRALIEGDELLNSFQVMCTSTLHEVPPDALVSSPEPNAVSTTVRICRNIRNFFSPLPLDGHRSWRLLRWMTKSF